MGHTSSEPIHCVLVEQQSLGGESEGAMRSGQGQSHCRTPGAWHVVGAQLFLEQMIYNSKSEHPEEKGPEKKWFLS